MQDIIVVLHKPRHPGNVGAVARALANFNCGGLRLVGPHCAIDGEARARAKHGRELLLEAQTYDDLTEAVADGNWVVATSGIAGSAALGYLRHPLSPWEFSQALIQRGGRSPPAGPLLLLFGPEDSGLSSDELALTEGVVTIPTNPAYPVLNLSQAVVVMLYELSRAMSLDGDGGAFEVAGDWRAKPAPRASYQQRSRLVERVQTIASRVGYRRHKLPRVRVMLRRILARADPSLWDYHTLMGLCRRLEYNLDRVEAMGPQVGPDEGD